MDLKTSVVATISGIAVPLTVYGHSKEEDGNLGVEIDQAVDWMGAKVDWRKLDDNGMSCEDALLGQLAEACHAGEY